MKKDNPDIEFGQVGKELGKLWKKCSKEDKKKYQKQADKDKARYEKEKEKYEKVSIFFPLLFFTTSLTLSLRKRKSLRRKNPTKLLYRLSFCRGPLPFFLYCTYFPNPSE